jgi:hypothetical protein
MDFCVIAPVGVIARAVLLFGPLLAIALFIASVAANGPTGRSTALICIMGFTAVFLASAYILQFRTKASIKRARSPGQSEFTYKKLYDTLQGIMRPSPISISLLHSSGVVILVILAIRLDATDRFGGSPANLDFGVKAGGGENIAFGPSFTTVGHCVQGVLASFLSYPAVAGVIARICRSQSSSYQGSATSSFLLKKPNLYVLLFCQLISALTTIYPSYSLIKRVIKDVEEFSVTSHMNNTTEWVLGYVLGVGIGWFVTILVQKHFVELSGLSEQNDNGRLSQISAQLTVSESNLGGNIEYGFGKSSEYKTMASSIVYCTVSILSTLLLSLVSAASLSTGVLIGLTWNFEEEKWADKVDQDMTFVFTCVWLAVTVVFTWFASKKWPFNFQ